MLLFIVMSSIILLSLQSSLAIIVPVVVKIFVVVDNPVATVKTASKYKEKLSLESKALASVV
jgi:hypothetical protein